MSMVESIFAGLTVLFVGSLAGVLWRQSGVQRHVAQLQAEVDRMTAHGQADMVTLAGLGATVTGQAQLSELGRRQNASEHRAIVDQLGKLTEHVLALKRVPLGAP